MRVHKRKKVTWGTVVIYAVLILFMLTILIPFLNAITISFISQDEYLLNKFTLIPKEPTLNAYRNILGEDWLIPAYTSSITISVLGLCYCLSINVLTAYALTRKFPLKKLVTVFLMIPMFFSGGLIPTYLLMGKLGLKNTYGAIILPVGVTMYYLLILMTFFRELPASLEESARLDGASELRILWSIYLPLSKAVLATISLFIVVGFWNDCFSALIYLDKPRRWPLQLHLRRIIDQATSSMNDRENAMKRVQVYAEGVRMASVIVTMLPIMFIYPFLQKYFAKGVMIGAVKG